MNKRRQQLLTIGVAFLVILSCRPTEMPTVTPVPATERPEATPRPDVTPTATPDPDDHQIRENLLRATVQIVALDETGGRFEPMWSGSGTIISDDGFILTNAHVASDVDPSFRPDTLGIALTIRSDEPPEPTYLAELYAIDFQLDLAVIKIATDLDGRPVDAKDLGLSYVNLGDSDALEVGDAVQILGYPGIGGETITFTEGVVSGFTREQGVEGRAWIKTDATIAGGNSGGLAASPNGTIVGIPTQLGYGGDDRYVDCRFLADTNGDGTIDQNDNCIPVGGFINALRPINLAKPLIEEAENNEPIDPGSGGGGIPDPSDEARFYSLLFGPDVTDDDEPTQVVSQLPSGALGVYAFWQYEGMNTGTTWEARWYHNNQYMENVSWPSSLWQGEEEGSYWVGVVNSNGLPDGTYKIELYIEDDKALEGSISVGGTSTGPIIAVTTFSDSDREPSVPTFELPSGISQIYAFFDYENMSDGMEWDTAWYQGGRQVTPPQPSTWDMGNRGSSYAYIYNDQGALPDGTYRLDISVEGTTVAQSSVTVGGGEPAGGLYIRGTILDADTGRGISGALFVVLMPGVTSETWTGSLDDIYTAAETDSSGYFELPDPLERGESYTMIAWAEGYQSIVGDGILIGDEPSPFDMEIELQRE